MKRLLKPVLLLSCGALLGALGLWALLSRSAALALTRRGSADAPASGEVWTLTAADGVALRAYACPAGEDWVLLLHGWGGCAGELEALGRAYRDRGYATLIPDLRGCGGSGGERQGLALGDREDVLAWLGRIRESCPNARVVLHGAGMGANAALCAAGTRPEGLAAVVAEGAFTGLWDLGEALLENWSGRRRPLLEWGASTATALYAGFGWRDLCPRRQAAGCRVPILFLRREGDGLIPAYMAGTLCRCAVKGSIAKTLPGGPGEGEARLTAVFAFLTGCRERSPAP